MIRVGLLIMVLCILFACGRDTDAPIAPPLGLQTISGSIKNFQSGKSLVLKNNGGDKITIPVGSKNFSFPTQLPVGARYEVTVISQPGQSCKVKNGSGTVSAVAVTDILITCIASKHGRIAIEKSAKTASSPLKNKAFRTEALHDEDLAQPTQTQPKVEIPATTLPNDVPIKSETVATPSEAPPATTAPAKLETAAKPTEAPPATNVPPKLEAVSPATVKSLVVEKKVPLTEEQIKQLAEQEKQFQRLYQRQQYDKLR